MGDVRPEGGAYLENRHMMWMVFAEDLDSQISGEIVTARECQEQIDKALAKRDVLV